MTVEQFHREFKIFFDKVDSLSYPEFLDGEIDIYLNEAQERMIKLRYGLNNNYRMGFEAIQKRTDDLKNLVLTKYCPLTPMDSARVTYGSLYKASLTSLFNNESLTESYNGSYQFYLKSTVKVSKPSCGSQWTRVKLIQQDDVTTIAVDPFNRPSFLKPNIFFEEGSIFIWSAPNVTVQGFTVTFIKRPVLINLGTYGQPKVECELSDHLHKEILQLAIQIAIENIQSPRVQTQGINVQTSE